VLHMWRTSPEACLSPQGGLPQVQQLWQGRRDCPNLSRAATRPPVQAPQQHQGRDRGNRPQAMGRVYAMSGAEASGSGNLVMGSCMIAGSSCCVLYDSGATHSFVSFACVERLGLPVSELSASSRCLLRRRDWSRRRLCVLGVQWR